MMLITFIVASLATQTLASSDQLEKHDFVSNFCNITPDYLIPRVSKKKKSKEEIELTANKLKSIAKQVKELQDRGMNMYHFGWEAQETAAGKHLIGFNETIAIDPETGKHGQLIPELATKAFETMACMFISTYVHKENYRHSDWAVRKTVPFQYGGERAVSYIPILRSVQKFMDQYINPKRLDVCPTADFHKFCKGKKIDHLSVCAAGIIAVKHLLDTKRSRTKDDKKFDEMFKHALDQFIGRNKRIRVVHMHTYLKIFCQRLIKAVVDADRGIIDLTKDDLDQKWAKEIAPSKDDLEKLREAEANDKAELLKLMVN